MIRGTKIKNSEGSPYPASEDIYQTVFEEAADGIFLADGQGSYIDVNRRGCEMLGYAREELLSLSIKDLVPPEDLVRDPPQLDELRAGKTLLRERRLRRGDDSLLSVEISTRMLADGRFLSIVRDISERKQAEELLRQQEHEFRTLMEHSPDIIARFDREGRYLYVNSTMEKVTGIPVEEFLGRRIGERLSALMKQVVPEEVLDLRQVIDRVFTSGCGFETEIHLIFPSGEHVFNVRLIPEADKAGEVVSVLLFARDVTEQKQAEKALRTSEERLQLALNAAQMGQWDWNMVTGEVVWSPKCLAIYGLSPNAPMSYERFLQAVHPEDRERIDAALKRAVEECSCYDEMKRIIWPDGSLHWTASRGQAYCEAAGQPVRMIGVTIDITEWKEAEEKLRHTAKELQRVMASISDYLWSAEVDEDGNWRYSYHSPVVEKITGRPPAFYLDDPQRWLATIHPDDRPRLLEAFQRVADGHSEREEKEYRILRPDGAIRWVRDCATVTRLGPHRLRIDGVVSDISERKQVEVEHRVHLRFLENMDRLNRAIQGTNDIEQMVNNVLDVVLTIFDCDRAWLIYPCDPEAPAWQSLMERTRPEYPGALALGLKVAMDPSVVEVFRIVRGARGPVKFGAEAEHPLPAETARQFSIQSQMAMAIYPKTGSPWMFGLHQCTYPRVWTPEEERLFQEIGRRVADALTSLLVYRDLQVENAERRRAETELQQHRAHLEEQVATRTAQLAAAKAKAEEADRLKSAFLATMSHELRTPLNSIIGFTGIMLQGMTGPLNDEQQLQLDMVKHSARHLLDLINDILDLSKIEAGQVELQRVRFNMAAVIDKTVQALMPLAEKKQLELVTDIGDQLFELFSDVHRVEQILINLINNAIKFTERGQVCVACRVGEGVLLTSVADTGIGIKPEDLKNLFTNFRQLDSTLGRRHEGTGLGLSICRKLAGLLGGEIRVESTWGAGSRFTLVLPLHASSQGRRQR